MGIVCGWFDNLDLQVCTTNGRRDTHVMAHQFQLSHPAGIIETGTARPGISSLIIPRIKKQESARQQTNVDTTAIKLLHYTGKKQMDPPALSVPSVAYTDVCAMQTTLNSAQEKDMQWLNTLFLSTPEDTPMEWSGFNSCLARSQTPPVPKSATTYLFGPLIDAPPAHPDTVLTSLVYMQKSLTDLGMSYAHLSIDMQLYQVAQRIKWSEPERFQQIVLRPGAMHIVQSFCGCIGSLMKGSGVDVLISAAFGGLTGILNGKSWVRAMRAYRMVTCALLQEFLSTGAKTFEELSQYLEDNRSHPTGRLWVDNLIVPTLIVHQFLRSEREGDWYLQQLCLQRMLPYFFAARHIHYARYITWHLLEMRCLSAAAKADLVSGAFVCRHRQGSWNAVSSDQFGEQTAIKIGKGGLRE